MAQTVDIKKLLGGGGSEKDDMIQTDFATLFIIEGDKASMPVPLELQAKMKLTEVPMQGFEELESTNYELYYTDFGHKGSELHEIYQELRTGSSEESTLTTFINSPGGSVYEGMYLTNIARECFAGRHITVLEVEAASMGAMAFAAGDKRIAYEFSSFMLHDYAGWSYGTGGNSLRQAEHYNHWLDSASKRILVDSCFLSEDEFQELKNGTEVYYETPEMVLRGIATDVVVEDVLLSGAEFLEYYDSKLPLKEFIVLKEEMEAAEASEGAYSKEEVAEMILSGELQFEVKKA